MILNINFTQEELAITTKLQEIIAKEIALSGNGIPFSRYMELALYHQDYGYYNNLLYKFGREGDFITSPNLSNFFAETLSRQIIELFQCIPQKNILEVGGGNGDLMLGILASLGDQIEYYYVLDLSATSTQLQQQKVKEKCPQYIDKIIWLRELPIEFNGVILGNEVLDAMPSTAIKFTQDSSLSLRLVNLANDQLAFNDIAIDAAPISSSLKSQIENVCAKIKVGNYPYISEINLNNIGFINSLSKVLQQGAIILIDYGYVHDEYYALERNLGTLRGFFRHQLVENVLHYPGLIDITSSVDFSLIAESGIESGIDLIGYTTQANFLLNCGILELHTAKQNKISAADFIINSNHVNKLTSPNHMGEVFKVIGFSKNIDFCDWQGFTFNDKTHTL